MSLVLDRGGTSLDHVAIGVPDTQRGVADFAELTGYQPVLHEPDPSVFYWSGTLAMGDGKFLEILGPNPKFKGFNPFIEMVKRLDRPQPLFWYVATDDFDAFCAASEAAGGPIERVTEHSAQYDGAPMDFVRGIIGPGFASVSPNVIQWRQRSTTMTELDGPTLVELQLSHPDAERLNALFACLGIKQEVIEGRHRISLTIGAANGQAIFEGDGIEFRGIGAILQMARLYGQWLIGKLR